MKNKKINMYSKLVEKNGINLTTIETPNTIIPKPSDDDYKMGYINRYFAQKSNDKSSSVFEIDNDTYFELFENPYWTVVLINWRISGPINKKINPQTGMVMDEGVIDYNNKQKQKALKTIPNISYYIQNPLLFYRGYDL